MKFLFSSIGQKVQIALSGILLAIFLLFHLFNNFALFAGKDTFNAMVKFLESIKPIIRVMEFGLLGIILIHTINAFKITLYNKRATGSKYKYNAQSETSSINSRTMAISGTIVLLFLIIHLGFVWFTYQTTDSHDYYQILLQNKVGFLGHTPTAIFYIISISLISFHLKHGFDSALKTFGISANDKLGILYKLSIIFWAFIPFGFIFIVFCIQIGIIS